jgi:hypothetical protein
MNRCNRSRRAMLGALGTLGLTASAGCLGLLGAEPRREGAADVGSGGTTIGDESSGADDRIEASSDNSSSSGDESDTASEDGAQGTTPDESADASEPAERILIGPVNSPATNEDYGEYVDDPEGNLGLDGVTLEVTGAEFEPGATGIERKAFAFDIADDGFTVTGRVHSAFKCDTFDLERVIVAGRDAIVGIVVQQTDTPDCHDLSHYWAHGIEVMGQFTGGHPDRLRIPVRTEQDQFVEETGL